MPVILFAFVGKALLFILIVVILAVVGLIALIKKIL